MVLGNSIGLNVINISQPTLSGATHFWSWVYVAATLLFSYYLGGLFGTRSNSITSSASGGLHALSSWALATSLALLMGSFFSPPFRTFLTSGGLVSLNWLAVCVIGVGLFAALMGGTAGKESVQYVKTNVEKPESEKRIA